MSNEKRDSETMNKFDRRQEKRRERQKEKREMFFWKLGGAVFAVAVVIAVGVTGVNQFKAYQASRPDYNRTQMVVSDMAGVLDAEESESAAEGETAAAEETEAAEETAAEETEAAGETAAE